MPRIFDNIELRLLPTLQETLRLANHADFCVGYFNLRGWKHLDPYVEFPEGQTCRLLVGMHTAPRDELRSLFSVGAAGDGESIDNRTAVALRRRLAEEFREQLIIGAPTNEDESALRSLVAKLRNGKVVAKLFLRHPLHAKLYLLFRSDPINPIVGYVGSSNLTFAGLSGQGELNVDVLEEDAGKKLARWFDERWNDKWCLDLTQDLIKVLEESWARESTIPPYHIYVKMAYHLSEEARTGLNEFRVPPAFSGKLFEFQTAAVKIAAHHLNKRGGVLIGDVVGLGKTIMATAVAKIFEDDYGLETLIICPKNLVKMWEDYRDQYGLRARVISISRVGQDLPNLQRYRLVLIDESHNLRNREGRRYQIIQEYIQKNDSKVILLSATPYNKTYLDLGSQLRLFVPPDKDLGVRPEQALRAMGETEFLRAHQCSLRSLAAFEHSEHADDWRELMRLYLVRRTRGFIKDNYAQTDPSNDRKYLTFPDGSRSYFPTRKPRTLGFLIDDSDRNDQYARLYSNYVVDLVARLTLPRYGLGNYLAKSLPSNTTADDRKLLENLSRAGRRLIGFCRTNLFKRLESSGAVFLISVERHILRNYVFLHAIEHGLPLPLGTQETELLNAGAIDEDVESPNVVLELDSIDALDDESATATEPSPPAGPRTEAEYRARAQSVYEWYAMNRRRRFKWLRPQLLTEKLGADLRDDALKLIEILGHAGNWDARSDHKLDALARLVRDEHPNEKVIVFTQFADTARYLREALAVRGISRLAAVTGQSADPTALAWRFSPVSNGKREQVRPEDELRVLVATDVLSEGQNLQDCAIVVNYDLPWAIIRLIQRAGRVDRIGQKADTILCCSFLPADGVERLIRLRERVNTRLRENAQVVGTDEEFFEGDLDGQAVVDLYNEKSDIFDGDADTEVDLSSYAYQIWKNAISADHSLERKIRALPSVVFSTRQQRATDVGPQGAAVYVRTSGGNNALVWMDEDGRSVTESQFAILKAAECGPDEPAAPRLERHHEIVREALALVAREQSSVGGQLGSPAGARFRTYERLKHHAESLIGTLDSQTDDYRELVRAIEEIYRYPLRGVATDILNRQLRSSIRDEALASLIISLRTEGRLCQIEESTTTDKEPQVICSLGLRA